METLAFLIVGYFLQSSIIQIVHDRQEARPVVQAMTKEDLSNRWDLQINISTNTKEVN